MYASAASHRAAGVGQGVAELGVEQGRAPRRRERWRRDRDRPRAGRRARAVGPASAASRAGSGRCPRPRPRGSARTRTRGRGCGRRSAPWRARGGACVARRAAGSVSPSRGCGRAPSRSRRRRRTRGWRRGARRRSGDGGGALAVPQLGGRTCDRVGDRDRARRPRSPGERPGVRPRGARRARGITSSRATDVGAEAGVLALPPSLAPPGEAPRRTAGCPWASDAMALREGSSSGPSRARANSVASALDSRPTSISRNAQALPSRSRASRKASSARLASASSLRWPHRRSSGRGAGEASSVSRSCTLSASPHCRSSTWMTRGRRDAIDESSSFIAANALRRSSMRSATSVSGSPATACTFRSTGNRRARACTSPGRTPYTSSSGRRPSHRHSSSITWSTALNGTASRS